MTKNGIERLGGRLCFSFTLAAMAMGWSISLPAHAGEEAPVKPTPPKPAAATEVARVLPVNPAMSPQHEANTSKVARIFRIADGMIDIGSFDEAKAAYNQVLGIDPTNAAARRGMEKAERLISEALRAARDHTRAKMMNEVDAQYELAVPRVTIVPELADATSAESGNASGSPSSKLDSIVYPQIAMSETLMTDALGYLRRKAQEIGGNGIGLLWIPGGKADSEFAPITLDLKNSTLRSVLRAITEMTGTRFRTQGANIIVYAGGGSNMLTRQFTMPPAFLTTTASSVLPGGDAADPFGSANGSSENKPSFRKLGVKEFLTQQGVTFPEGATAGYTPATNTITVTNTEENLDLIASLADSLSTREQRQVSIQVVLLSATEVAMKEHGYDWLVEQAAVGKGGVFAGGGTGGLPITGSAANSPGSAGGTGSIVPFNVVSGSITSSLRSAYELNANQTVDNLIASSASGAASGNLASPAIAAVAGVMTSPRFQTLLRALDQRKGIDLSVANRIVVKSGQKASAFSGRKMMYPVEFDPPQIPQNFGNTSTTGGFGLSSLLGGGNSGSFPVTPSTPSSFSEKDVGAGLEVEAIIGEDGATIDVDLSCIFHEFDGFINYGTPITNGAQVLTENRIIQPVFSKIAAVTKVNIYDGQTIAIGGLSTDKVETVNDKVPIYSSIPIIGRLFKSTLSRNSRKVIVYFVTVKILDPAGHAVSDAGHGSETH